MDFLIDVIISGFTWDIIKKLAQGIINATNFSGILFESLQNAADLNTCKQITARVQSLYLPYHSFEEYVKALQNDEEYLDCINSNVNYKTEFAKRLDYYISLTNVYSNQKNQSRKNC